MKMKRESVVTYLFVFVLVGCAIYGLYFLNVSLTGYAVYTPGPEVGQTTLTLQDADIDNLDDAYVDGGVANKNRGIDTDLNTQRNPYQRIYIKFDISQIPVNQIIDNSKLCLYLYNDQSSQTISASHVYVHDWNEGSEDGVDVSGQDYTTNITWNNQPCGIDFDNSAACNLTAESITTNDGTLDGTWQCWNVTSAIFSEYGSGDKNVSIVLYTDDLGNPDIFYSKEILDSSLRPYMNITYHLANTAPTITLVSPQDQLYTSNESLSLNFTVSDSDGNLDSCWYTLDAGITNTSILNCANTTFNVSEGSHTLVIYVNDSLGLEASDNVSFDIDLTGISVLIIEPTGTKTLRTEIPITYTIVGDNPYCWYNVKTSIGGEVIANTTLENCSDSSFDVASDGDYILNLYANNSFGSVASDSSSFSVSTSSQTVIVSGGGGGGGGSSSTTIITLNGTTQLTVDGIQNLVVNPKDVKQVSWSVKNTGTNFLNGCKVKGEEGYASWISSEEVKNLAAGEQYGFVFDVTVPETVESGKYTLTISLTCAEISEFSSFVVEILEKKIGFDLIEVSRVEDNQMKITYLIKELSGLEQEIEMQFLLFDSNNEKAVEVKETKVVSANSQQEFEILIPVDSSLKGELSLLVNLNSETYSTFVQENVILGSPISGFALFGEGKEGFDNLLSLIFILLFFVFAFFLVRKIFKHKKKK